MIDSNWTKFIKSGKVEDYLKRCIDSVLDQKFDDFEMILVDDGSPDNCPRICDEYAAKDDRIKVIHKENGGLVSARQAGIRIAQGEYHVSNQCPPTRSKRSAPCNHIQLSRFAAIISA